MTTKMMLAGAALITLSACAGQELSSAQKITPQGSEFQNALSAGYLRLAQDEYKETDYRDSDYFARRSISAGGGTTVQLPEVTERDLPQGDAIYVAGAREELAEILDASAREKAPQLAATAQVAYECWIQELEENLQPEHIAACRDQLDELIPALRNAIAEAPPMPAPVEKPLVKGQSYQVLFETGSAELSDAANATVGRAARLAASIGKVRVVVNGHTDTVGSALANRALSKKRADVVAAALRIRGVPRDAITAWFSGENDLTIPTADSTEEKNNRRVDITVSPGR